MLTLCVKRDQMLNIFKLHISSRWFSKAEVRHQGELKKTMLAWGDIDEEEILQRVRKKRKGIFISLALVLFSLATGVFSAELICRHYELSLIQIRWLRMGAIGLVGWAVLARLGYESETMKGVTLLELTSLNSFKLFYLLALYLAALCLFLYPIST